LLVKKGKIPAAITAILPDLIKMAENKSYDKNIPLINKFMEIIYSLTIT
jgi:hypothetical protein